MTLTRTKTTERYRDCQGLAFDEVRGYVQKHYGPRTADWPSIKTVADWRVGALAHQLWDYCWNCKHKAWSQFNKIECHHLVGGARRSDELCNIAMLCNECHANVKTEGLPQGRILYLKWNHDRQHCNWARLCLLSRKFLPDLIARTEQ